MVERDREALRNVQRRIDELEKESDKRHEDNLQRFYGLELKAARVEGELKVIILLLIALLGTNVAHLFGG